MNPDQPSREQIEARITALLLGELPAAEAELLRWTISQDAELQKLHGRLLLTVGLVREVVAHPEEASAEKVVPRQLSGERRQKLLAHFKTPRPVPKQFFWLKRLEIHPLVATLALVAVLAVLAAMLLPALGAAKRKGMHVTMMSGRAVTAEENASVDNLRQVKGAVNEWALESSSQKPSVTVSVPPAPARRPPTRAEIVLPKAESEPSGMSAQNVVGYTLNNVFNHSAALPPVPAPSVAPTGPTPANDETEIRVFRLQHASPTEMANELGSVFPKTKQPSGENAQQVTAVADPRTQAVIVTAPKELMPEVSGLMDELDVASDRDQGVAVVQVQNGDQQQVAQTLQNMFGNGNASRGAAGSSQNSALQQRQQSATTAMGATTAGIGGGAIAFGGGGNFGGAGGFGGGGRGGGGFGGGGGSAGRTDGLRTAEPVANANPVDLSGSVAEGRMSDFVTLERASQSGNDKTAAATLVQDGKLLYEMGRFKDAEDKLNQALKADPNNQGAYYYLNLDKQANFTREEQNRTTQAANSMVDVAKAWSPKLGIGLPVSNPNSSTVPATPTETTLAWNNSGAVPMQIVPQTGSLVPVINVVAGVLPSAASPPGQFVGNTAATTGSRIAVDSFDSANGVAAAQNQAGGGNTFYRSQNGEIAAEKEKTPVLGDAPLVGRWFASSAMAPTVSPTPSSTPARPEMFFKLSDSGPENTAENSAPKTEATGNTLALNAINSFVANNGTLALNDLGTINGTTTSQSDGMNLDVAEPKQHILTGFSFNAGDSGQQQSAEVAQNTPFQQRVLPISGLPATAQSENNKLAFGSSDQMLANGLRNNQNGAAGQATVTVDPVTHNLVVVADEATEEQIRRVVANLDKPAGQMLIGKGINNPAPAPGMTPVITPPSMVARFALAATNAVAPNPTLTQQQLQSYKDQSETERSQPYWEAKRKLDNLTDFHKLLQAKIAAERLDLEIPKTSTVTIVDQAQPAQSQNTWQRITGEVESKARIEVNPDVTDIQGISGSRAEVSGNYDPYLVQTEIETIQSDAVLGKVVDALKLDETWAKKNGGERLSKEAAIALLKKRLDLKPEKNSKLVEIGAISDKPDEATKIANAVMQAYQDYRLEKRGQLTLAGVQTLQAKFVKEEEQIRLAQAEVDRLAKEANVAQSDQPLPRPAATNAPIPQPEFLTRENAFSTFSMNISDVSFKLAQASLQKGQMPDPASIRSEEFINAFNYRDPEATAGQPLAFASELARDPFAHNRDLLRFSVKTAAAGRQAGRALNLVLLLDTSGSMERADRVAIVREALRVLAAQLQPQDTVSVVTFARTARLWADGVSGDKASATLDQVGGITPEGGTNLEEAMRLAYETAHRHYLAQGVNRVVLLTDGAANLGNVDPNVLKQTVEAQRRQGIALDCFGIGWEDFNDDLLEQLSGNGDGRYAFINSPDEAGTDFAAKLAGALQVAAQDVKVQVEFNPQRVVSWRQIGYAKHQLTKEQFRDNTVLAAEIAAQEAGNALYTVETKPDGAGPIATVYVRYRIPGTQDVRERSWAVNYDGPAPALDQSSAAMRLAAVAAEFSEWLAASPFAQEVTPDELLKHLSGVPQIYGADQRPQQLEWMIRQAKSLSGQTIPPSQPGLSGQQGRF